MFDDAFAHFEGEIEPGEIEIALLELFDDAKRMEVVVKAIAVLAHSEVELLFARVAKGRVSDIVHQSERFGKAGVEMQGVGNGSRNLRNFDGVGQPVAKMVGVTRGENLGLGFQTAKGARVNYAVAVARVSVAVGVRRLRKAATARALYVHRIGCQRRRRHSARSDFAGQESKILVGLFGDRSVGVLRFNLGVYLSSFGRVICTVVLGKSKHHDRLGHQEAGLGNQLLIELDGLVPLSGTVIQLSEFEARHGGEVFLASVSNRLEQFLGFLVLAKVLFA